MVDSTGTVTRPTGGYRGQINRSTRIINKPLSNYPDIGLPMDLLVILSLRLVFKRNKVLIVEEVAMAGPAPSL